MSKCFRFYVTSFFDGVHVDSIPKTLLPIEYCIEYLYGKQASYACTIDLTA